MLGDAGKAAQVGKQHGDLSLLAGQIAGLGKAVAGLGSGRQQRNHGQVVGWPQLAGQPDVWWGADPSQHPLLGFAADRQQLKAAHNPHPAGRTPAASATYRGVLDAGPTADLQHAGALGSGQGLAGRVGDLNRPLGPNGEPPDDPDEAHPEHAEHIAADQSTVRFAVGSPPGPGWAH